MLLFKRAIFHKSRAYKIPDEPFPSLYKKIRCFFLSWVFQGADKVPLSKPYQTAILINAFKRTRPFFGIFRVLSNFNLFVYLSVENVAIIGALQLSKSVDFLLVFFSNFLRGGGGGGAEKKSRCLNQTRTRDFRRVHITECIFERNPQFFGT